MEMALLQELYQIYTDLPLSPLQILMLENKGAEIPQEALFTCDEDSFPDIKVLHTIVVRFLLRFGQTNVKPYIFCLFVGFHHC